MNASQSPDRSQVFQIQITDPDGNQRITPGREQTTIGRQVGNDLVLGDQRVSRRHAVIECDDEACQITDLDSSNGTLLDGQRLPPNVPTPLKPGSALQIGPFELTLMAQPATPEPIPEPAIVEPAEPERDEAEEPSAAPDPQEPVEADLPSEAASAGEAQPPVPPAPPAPPPQATSASLIPPGLSLESRHLINYLPGIYHTSFMRRLLGIFEAILTPIEWQIDNFDLYLDPGTAPVGFLAWMAGWFDVAFDPSWDEGQRRQLLEEAHRIYARRGTKWALSRVLEIYTGEVPTIVDTGEGLEPFTFRVTLPFSAARSEREMIERLIDAHKPAYTLYELEFAR